MKKLVLEAQEAIQAGDVEALTQLVHTMSQYCTPRPDPQAPGQRLEPGRRQDSRQRALEQAVDPQTGDTLLHLAAAHGQLAALRCLCDLSTSRLRWSFIWTHALLLQRNRQGDIPLHCAARQANLDVVRAVYRMVMRDALPGEDMETEAGGMPTETERDEARTADLDEVGLAAAVSVLGARNAQGQTPAETARASQQTANAQFLQGLLDRVDPDGTHQSAAAVAEAEHFLRSIGYLAEALGDY